MKAESLVEMEDLLRTVHRLAPFDLARPRHHSVEVKETHLLKRANVFKKVPAEDLLGLYMVVRAFPNAIDEQSYLPLIYLLSTRPDGIGMSYRSIAIFLSLYSGRHYAEFLNDAYAVEGKFKLDDVEVERVRLLLQNFGYDEWKKGDLPLVIYKEPAKPWWKFSLR